MSRRLIWEGLPNTRDLGGMKGADGRPVKMGKLIRSGQLFLAGQEAQAALGARNALVIDLRTSQERREKPNPVISGTKEIHLPITENLMAGITRENESDEQMAGRLMQREEDAAAYMINLYEHFATEPFAVAQYGKMMHILLEEREGPVLWHCTAGKDRAGFAAVMIEKLLGMDEETVLRDYMQTNEYLAEQVEMLFSVYAGKMPEGKVNRQAVQAIFGTREEYLEAVLRKIEKIWGGFDAFTEEGLGITEADRQRLRDLYLE